jgi:hypothetical protein
VSVTMLTLRDYDNSYGEAKAILFDKGIEVVVLDSAGTDITAALADGGILREESRDGFLYEVFGDLAAVASVALEIPDPELL